MRHVTPWDLIVVDEAHKMSATVFGTEVKRHFLLLTATPHNGKEADFQFFLGLLHPDRFEGKYREDHGHIDQRDVADLMRRLVKEDLLP